MLHMRIRGESIKFAIFFKKQTNAKEKQLIADIEHLERSNLDDENFDILADKKTELEELRKIASEMPVPTAWGNSFQHHEI